MITKQIDENSVALIAEESDDLFTLRRVIRRGDKLIGDTTRAVKQDKDFARPDKGERIRIRVALDVEKVSIDDVVDRLRVQGTISESDSESVSKGSHHSMTLMIDEPVTLVKKSWADLERRLIFGKGDRGSFLLVAVDTSDCGIETMKQALAKSKIAKVSSILDEIMRRVNKKNNKFTMGFDETSKANEAGAVESLVFSDKIFEKHDEDTVIEFLNQAEAKGVEVYAVDSTTDIGLRVSSLGGIVSLLRFSPFG